MDEEKDYDKVFYKDRWINEDNLEQHLIVTYSIKYRNYQRTIRERQLKRAKKLIDNPASLSKQKTNDPKRFIEQGHCTADGEVAPRLIDNLTTDALTLCSQQDKKSLMPKSSVRLFDNQGLY